MSIFLFRNKEMAKSSGFILPASLFALALLGILSALSVQMVSMMLQDWGLHRTFLQQEPQISKQLALILTDPTPPQNVCDEFRCALASTIQETPLFQFRPASLSQTLECQYDHFLDVRSRQSTVVHPQDCIVTSTLRLSTHFLGNIVQDRIVINSLDEQTFFVDGVLHSAIEIQSPSIVRIIAVGNIELSELSTTSSSVVELLSLTGTVEVANVHTPLVLLTYAANGSRILDHSPYTDLPHNRIPQYKKLLLSNDRKYSAAMP